MSQGCPSCKEMDIGIQQKLPAACALPRSHSNGDPNVQPSLVTVLTSSLWTGGSKGVARKELNTWDEMGEAAYFNPKDLLFIELELLFRSVPPSRPIHVAGDLLTWAKAELD